MAGRTSRAFLRVHSMGRPSKPSPNPQQITKVQTSPRKKNGAAALKPSVDLQKQKVEQLCEFLLGKASTSDNVFSNCQDSVKRLEVLQVEILEEVPWVKDLTEQNNIMKITGLLLKEFQKQKTEIKKLVEQLCDFLLGKASMSDNVFFNFLDSVKRLEVLRAEILEEVSLVKDLTEQNNFLGITGLLLEKLQKQKTEIKKLLDHQIEQERLMEYKAKQIKELQNKHEIRILEEEKNKNLISELNNIKLENQKLQEQTKNYLECIENHANQLKASKESEKKCQEELKQLKSVMKARNSSNSILSREVTRKSFKSDSGTCDSSESFANSETSTVPSVSSESETSQLSELSYANSSKSEEDVVQFPCILCSQTSHTTQTFLCKQCIDQKKII